MPNRKKWSDEDLKEFRRQYIAGRSRKDIKTEFGVSDFVLDIALEDAKEERKAAMEERNEAMICMRENGAKIMEVAKAFGVTIGCASHVLKGVTPVEDFDEEAFIFEWNRAREEVTKALETRKENKRTPRNKGSGRSLVRE